MHRWKSAPRSMVIVYFGGFVLLWSGVAAGLLSGRELAAPGSVLPFRGAHAHLASGIVALALHAAVVALLAWKADRWFFAHGPLAVVLAGVPLIPLVEKLWLVPAFLYLIAVLHVWLASLHESQGRLQASRRVAVALLAMTTAAGAAAADPTYPARPVKIMVGANAGGGTDIIARMLAEKFQETLKQPFVVENKPGASNTIAADLTAKAPPDGYTLLVATNTGQAIAPHLIKLSFDPLKQLQPVGLVVVVPNVLVVGAVTPYQSVKDLVAAARAKPGDIKYASSGVGSTQHIAGEAFDLAAGVKTTHIPYKGSSQAHVDLMSGEVQMMFDTTSSAMTQIKAGKFRALAVTSAARSAELPSVPTIAEAGYPAAEMTTWYGLFVTGGTPKPIVDLLHAELVKALALPDVQARLKGLGGEPGKLTIEQFTQMNKDEYDRFGKLIKTANIRVD